jgi:hypothetical protein
MNALLNAHIGGRLVAIIAGAIAITARTNDPCTRSRARGFSDSMLVLGVTASILARFKTPPEFGIGRSRASESLGHHHHSYNGNWKSGGYYRPAQL